MVWCNFCGYEVDNLQNHQDELHTDWTEFFLEDPFKDNEAGDAAQVATNSRENITQPEKVDRDTAGTSRPTVITYAGRNYNRSGRLNDRRTSKKRKARCQSSKILHSRRRATAKHNKEVTRAEHLYNQDQMNLEDTNSSKNVVKLP
ncbi:unnamed protein product [Allacma fusca]|uniref:Uncharacterized protein n=1 Tax=Allacma fusca TaxID=39272 RepID=A0A8J2K8X2_9HEXA|nr:unnamed protein product [Allacma fusca]